MNQSHDELAGKIVRYLDYGADHLDQTTRERLLDARKTALSKFKERPEPAWGLTWAGQAGPRQTEHRAHGARYLIAGAALIAALMSMLYWQSIRGPSNELAEIDAGLLTDELPINAYLDKGFDSWLSRSSR
jgi:hypothetical protein